MNLFFTLRTKNMLAFLCIAVITAIVGVTGYIGMKKLENKFKVVIESAPLIQSAINMKLTVSQDLMVVMKLMAALDTDELAATWNEHEAFAAQFEHIKNAVLNGAETESGTIFPAKDETLRDIVKKSAEYYSTNFNPSFTVIFDQMNKKLSAESYDYNLLDTIDEDTIAIGTQLEIQLNKVAQIAQAVIGQAEKEARETKSMAVRISMIATGMGILAALVLGFVFSGIVTKPVIQAAQFTETISDGDFTKVLDISRKDEIGFMATAMNNMVSGLANVFRDITTGVGTLNETSSQLSDVSQELKTRAQDMSDKSNAVSREAQEMNQRLSSVAEGSRQSSANLDTISAAVEEMTATVNEIANNTDHARAITDTAVTKTKSASERINELGIDAKEIQQFIEVIGEISDQTNLLALNATIEAARAGEAGKGFAVVANEIKALANQTADAARNIESKIKKIQNSTQGTVIEIEEISKVINDVDIIVSSIAGAIEEQSITSKEIARNVVQAVEGIHETNRHLADSSLASENIAKDISSVNENSTRVADSSRKVMENVIKLTDFAGHLKKILSNFKV